VDNSGPDKSRRAIRWLVIATAVGTAVFVGACGGEIEGQVQVFGYDDIFREDIIEIPVGGEVEWRIEGDNPHNVFAADEAWESPFVMERGDTFARTFDEPGVYPYFCTFHGTAEGDGMAGYVIVGDVPDYERPQPEDQTPVGAWSGATIEVPDDFSTIQEAVDAAAPGDMILVGPGVYNEAVVVRTPSLIIRGTDRNDAILDGQFTRPNGIHAVADAVAVENMTARNYTVNGFYWTGVTGYRGSYLTAHNNGDYGIYAFDSVDGLFEHSYASGNRDSGFYIGQCFPCNAVIEHVESEANGLGFSGTNAGGELYVINSYWHGNMGGVMPNSLDSELLAPQRDAYFGGNLIVDNNAADVPTTGSARLAWRVGIATAGSVGDVVEKNLVVNHERLGIATTVLPDKNIWWAEDNVIRDNVILGSGHADLALVGPWAPGNCFSNNRYERATVPFFLEFFHSCDGINLPIVWDLMSTFLLVGISGDANSETPAGADYQTFPAPGPQSSMPDAAATPQPAFEVFVKPDLDAIVVPDLPADTEIEGVAILMTGVPVTQPTLWTILFSLWAYFLPLALLASWFALALWDIVRRQDDGMSRGLTVTWVAVIFLIPILGVIAYYIFGKSSIPVWLRWLLIGGGIGAYLIILAILLVTSGAV